MSERGWEWLIGIVLVASAISYAWDGTKKWRQNRAQGRNPENEPAQPGSPERALPEGPAGDLLKRLQAWREQRLRRERVFLAELGRWPKVWKTGEGRYLVSARHYSPGGQKEAGQLALIVTILAGLWLWSALSQDWPAGVDGAGSWMERHGWPIVLLGLFVLFGGRVLRGFEPWLAASPDRLYFDRGKIEWRAKQQKWWRIGLGAARRERIFPHETGRVRVVVPHRKAVLEMRRAQQIDRQQKRTPRLYYVDASEVVIDVGADLSHPLAVAEISFDENGEKARKLAAAIKLARDASLGEDQAGIEVVTNQRRGMFG